MRKTEVVNCFKVRSDAAQLPSKKEKQEKKCTTNILRWFNQINNNINFKIISCIRPFLPELFNRFVNMTPGHGPGNEPASSKEHKQLQIALLFFIHFLFFKLNWISHTYQRWYEKRKNQCELKKSKKPQPGTKSQNPSCPHVEIIPSRGSIDKSAYMHRYWEFNNLELRQKFVTSGHQWSCNSVTKLL